MLGQALASLSGPLGQSSSPLDLNHILQAVLGGISSPSTGDAAPLTPGGAFSGQDPRNPLLYHLTGATPPTGSGGANPFAQQTPDLSPFTTAGGNLADMGKAWGAQSAVNAQPQVQQAKRPQTLQDVIDSVPPVNLGFSGDDIAKRIQMANDLKEKAAGMVPPTHPSGLLRPGTALTGAALAAIIQGLSGRYSNAGPETIASLMQGNQSLQNQKYEQDLNQHNSAQQQLLAQAQGHEQAASQMQSVMSAANAQRAAMIDRGISVLPYTSGDRYDIAKLGADAKERVAKIMQDPRILAVMNGTKSPGERLMVAQHMGITDPDVLTALAQPTANESQQSARGNYLNTTAQPKADLLAAQAGAAKSTSAWKDELTKLLPAKQAGQLGLWLAQGNAATSNAASAASNAVTNSTNAGTKQGELGVAQQNADTQRVQVLRQMSLNDADLTLNKMKALDSNYSRQLGDLQVKLSAAPDDDAKAAISKRIGELQSKQSDLSDSIKGFQGFTVQKLAQSILDKKPLVPNSVNDLGTKLGMIAINRGVPAGWLLPRLTAIMGTDPRRLQQAMNAINAGKDVGMVIRKLTGEDTNQ